MQILLRNHPAGRIVWRVHDDHPGSIRDFRAKLLNIEAKSFRLLQSKRDRGGSHEVDHRFIDRVAGIRIDHFIPFFDACKHGEEDDRLPARHDDDLLRLDRNPPCPRDVLGNCLPKLRNARRQTVVSVVLIESELCRIFDVFGCVAGRFADRERDNVATFCPQKVHLG